MPIDAGIYERRPVRSIAEITNALLANDRAGLENGLMAQKADEYRRGVADDAQMRDLVRSSGGDPARLRDALVQRGDVKALDAHDKGQMELAKGTAEIGFKGAQTQEHQAGADVKRIQAMRDGAAYAAQGLAKVNVQDDASIVDWYKDAVTKGLIKSEDAIAEINKVPPAGPAREQWKAQQQQAGMTMIEQANKQLETQRNAETNRSNVARETETGRHNRNTEGLTARGQNMVDARSRESTAATMTKPFEVTGPDGQPVLVQQDRQGNISPVQGYGPKPGSSKPLTDAQAKALGFGTRMQESDKILNTIGNDFSPAGVNTKNALSRAPLIGGALEMGANAMLSDNSQKAEQAQRDFVNAILRRESGAAVSESEFSNARKQYFPQPGDSEALKTQKAANRKLAMEGVLAEVPKGQRGTIGPQAEPAGMPPMSAIDAELARRGGR